jgi:4-hydroxy-tetrahydrodipicolinate synthase
MSDRVGGVWIPASTPFEGNGNVSQPLFLKHCQTLLKEGADGLAILGTTSEANSLSLAERLEILEYLLGNGIRADQLMPGTGACSIVEAVQMTRAVVKAGCAGALVLPPFYYKVVEDDGLFAYFSELIERVGDERLRLYLYHIPPVAQVGFSLNLIERLLKRYPKIIAGLKDSSGDFKNTLSVIKAFPSMRVFPGSESFLLDGLRAGGAGCITATGNINVAAVKQVYLHWQEPQADSLQDAVTRRRKLVESYPVIPAVKAVLARRYDDTTWGKTRAPLVALDEARAAKLTAALAEDGYKFTNSQLMG